METSKTNNPQAFTSKDLLEAASALILAMPVLRIMRRKALAQATPLEVLAIEMAANDLVVNSMILIAVLGKHNLLLPETIQERVLSVLRNAKVTSEELAAFNDIFAVMNKAEELLA